ncbi:MAG: putative growth inhibitor, PemK-like protein [Bacteroidota bacterium]|jgi:mRNA interferase MazF
MKQGEIWFTDLNPVKGSEQAGYRPVIIISGNLLNVHAQVVVCVPLTTQLKHYHGNLVLEPSTSNGLKQTSEALTLHVRSIAKDRLLERVGSISKTELKQIHTCLNEILTY